MQVFIKTMAGKPLALEVELTKRIEEVKVKIQGKERIPVDQQRLVFTHRQMEDDHTLEDYEVQRDSIIRLVVRLRGSLSTD
jgi:ubiquitin